MIQNCGIYFYLYHIYSISYRDSVIRGSTMHSLAGYQVLQVEQ